MANLQITFAQTDPTAKADIAAIGASAHKPWSLIDDLRQDSIPQPGNYATLEHNYTILDGSMEEFPDNIQSGTWGFWSEHTSDENGEFTEPPSLDISFGANHKSYGLTLYFYPHTDDYAKAVRVTWYDSSGSIIRTGTYAIKSNIGIIGEAVMDFQRIKLEMLSTNNRHRYIKLYGIEYGITRILMDNEIDSCRILEEIDPTVESISVNTLNARIRTREPFFSPVSGEIADGMMMKRQVLTISRDNIPFGTFFLENWKDVYQSGLVFDFEASDAVGVLDLYTFMGGIYDNVLASDLLTEIFNVTFPTGLVKYVLDPAFSQSRLSGWIPICSCGEAFQHVCFALNATADTARIGDVWVYPREADIKFDSAPFSEDKQPWVRMSDLKSYSPPIYFPTSEHNYTTLDGDLDEFPDNTSSANLGWCSMSMSGADGLFDVPPVLEVSFGTNHNTEAITLDFGPYDNEYIKTVHITWYDEYDNELVSKTYTTSQNPTVITESVSGYRRIKFEMLRTNNPYRYARIASIDYGKSFYLPLNRQYRRGSTGPTEYYSGVDVISHHYTEGAETMEVQNGILAAGCYTIEFPEPLHSLVIAGGTILHAHPNYAGINVAVTGTVVITGRKYIDNRLTHRVRADIIAGEVERIKRYENYTLVKPSIGAELAQKIFDYLKGRIQIESDIVLDNREVGYIAEVETPGRHVAGVITRLDINLRANKAGMVVIGNVMD